MFFQTKKIGILIIYQPKLPFHSWFYLTFMTTKKEVLKISLYGELVNGKEGLKCYIKQNFICISQSDNPCSPTENKMVFCGFFSLQRKKGVNGSVIATKVPLYNIFRLKPKFTLVYTLFSMVMQQKDTRFHPFSKKGWAYFR